MPKRKANAGGGSEAAGEGDANQAVLEDVLRVVRDCLVKLKAGDLLVVADLGKECYDQLTPATTADEDGNEKMTKVFKAFLGAVADTLAEETTMDSADDAKMVKKMRKKWNKLLKENFEAVEEEVTKAIKSQADDPDQHQDMADADDDAGSSAAAATSGKDDEDNDITSEHEFNDDDDDDDDESGAESRGSSKRSKSSKSSKSSSKKKSKKAKRKAKKKKREKKKKRKAREMADLDASDAEDGDGGRGVSALNGMSREEAREMFVRERDETLSQIPKDVKERFRECGFATWGKVVYPIIELGPYDVPPGDLRDQWFAMFENCQKSQRAMTRLIYWYGTENLEEGYSFYQANKIVRYEKGLEKGNDKVPSGIQKKLDGNKKLTKTDKQIVKGLEQIAEDSQLEASERVAWLPEWEEDWEDDDNFDDDLEEGEDDQEEELEDDGSNAASRSKKKGGNKSKKGKDDSSATKKRKKKKGKKRKKAGDDTDDDDDLGDSEADTTGEKSGASSDDNSSVPLAPKNNTKKVKASKVVYKDDNEEPEDVKVASDDENDEDFSDEVSSSSDEEEEYVEDPGSGSGGPKKRKRKADDGDTTGRKKKKGSGEPKAKREKKQTAASKGPKVNSKAAEQRYFDECEDLFLPLMRELKIAIGADDLKTCELCVMKFQRYVEKVTPSFIRVHQFGLVVKESRKAFKSKGRDDLVSLCHELTKDLKRIYTEKLPLMPEGFEPKIRRQKKKDASSARKKKPKADAEDSASDDEAEDRKTSSNAKISNGDAGHATVVDISKKSVDDEPAKAMAPEKKTAFSLKGMFQRPQKTAPAAKEKSIDRASISVQRSGGSQAKQMPSWLKGPLPADISTPADDDRSLAVEFLQDAFANFPEGKIDANSASLVLESAINDWSAARSDKSEVYWEKTHDIVAALSGMVEPTSLVQELLDGKFETPRDLLRITRKRLNGYVGGLTE